MIGVMKTKKTEPKKKEVKKALMTKNKKTKGTKTPNQSKKVVKGKRLRFCEEYVIDMNATQSAIRAGYSLKTAYSIGQRLLKKVEIMEKIAELQKKVADEVKLNAEYVLNGLMEVHERCMQKEAVKDNQGNTTGEWKFEHSGANRSLELLGKHLKLFTDQVETKTDININWNEEKSY